MGCFERVKEKDDILVEEAFKNADLATKVIELALTLASEIRTSLTAW